jgi:hypothetical protein
MNWPIVARALRWLVVACFVAVVFLVVAVSLSAMLGSSATSLLLPPFLAAAVSVAGLALLQNRIGQLVSRVAHVPLTSRYSALAATVARIRAGSLEQALPGLAQVLANGTGAQRAEVWLAVDERLVSAARYPTSPNDTPRALENLGVLLAQPDSSHVVPVLDGSRLRAALAIGKPGRPVTPDDQLLMQDVARGAGMLLRGVRLNVELEGRVRRAAELADELQASRGRLAHARQVERCRLVTELGNATTGRLATLRADLADAGDALDEILEDTPKPDSEASPQTSPAADAARRAVQLARTGLDELLERFRVIARGVYPAVLRDQGPPSALDELATDLLRPVVVAGRLPARLAWEVESGIYYVAASAMQLLGENPTERALRVQVAHADGRLAVRLDDPSPPMSVEQLRHGLAGDIDRLAALGGDVEIKQDESGTIVLRGWIPDQLTPSVDLITRQAGHERPGTS